MNTLHVVAIDPSEQFPNLNRAPIVEAVVDLRARAEIEWNESVVIIGWPAVKPSQKSLAEQLAASSTYVRKP